MLAIGLKYPRIGAVKTMGAVVTLAAAAALVPASAAAQSQSDTTAGAKAAAKAGAGVRVIQVSPSSATAKADTTHVHVDSTGKSVIRVTPQSGQGEEIILQMQGPDGKQEGIMSRTFKIQVQQVQGEGDIQDQGQHKAGGQPKIRTEGSAADTTAGKSAPAVTDSTKKAPAR